MRTVYFPSLDDADTVQVEFLTASGSRQLRLLVDSGFTGQSSLVISSKELDLIRAVVDPAQATGALRGEQNRAWVTCQIPELGFQKTVIAILADLTALSLPSTVEGMVGLTLLRTFHRWGSERSDSGWRFFLTLEND